MLLALFITFATQTGEHPLLLDRTGIEWSLSFEAARARAAQEQRMLMIKPARVPTSPDGHWCPAAEVLRAGAWSDGRVVRLINRRFVPFYFDLGADGAAADAPARAFVLSLKPELAEPSTEAPPVLIVSPDGTLIEELSNYAGEREFLAVLGDALAEHPQFDEPQPDELEGPVHTVARAWLDLGRADRALDVLAGEASSEAAYLRGHIARRRGDWEQMERHFSEVLEPGLFDDVRMERAYRLWHAERFAQLLDELDGFPQESNRYTEARYYRGLAQYHSADAAGARRTWGGLIRLSQEGPWVYRADWAHASSESERSRKHVPAGAERTLLGRFGYARRPNPDLTGPGAP